MMPGLRMVWASFILIVCTAAVVAQNSFQEDRYLREYFWQKSIGRFVKFEPIRDASELERTMGLLVWEEEGKWYEKSGCFTELSPQIPEVTRGSYTATTFAVWDKGSWPPPVPPMSVSLLGSQVSFNSNPNETLRRLELQISIPQAVTYRRERKEFWKAARSRDFSEDCLEILRRPGSYIVSEFIIGREAYTYRRLTNQNVYPISEVGLPDFEEVRPGQYQRTREMILAHRGLEPVWKKHNQEWVLTGFRPASLKERRGA